MRYFDHLTDEQIAGLEDDFITKTINLACADKGIPVFLDDVGEQPKPKVEPDRAYFVVGQWMFENSEQADKVCALINSTERFKRAYNYRNYSETRTAERDETLAKAEKLMLFSPDAAHQYQAEIQMQERREADWKKRHEAASAASNAREKIAGDVWREVMESKDKINDAVRIDGLFQKYLALADGDRAIARRFLIAAEKLDESWRPSDEPEASEVHADEVAV